MTIRKCHAIGKFSDEKKKTAEFSECTLFGKLFCTNLTLVIDAYEPTEPVLKKKLSVSTFLMEFSLQHTTNWSSNLIK